MIRNMPYLTSVYTDTNPKHLGDIQRDTPLFIDTFGADIAAFLDHNKLRFEESHRTFVYINNGYCPDFQVPTQLGQRSSATIAISFFGPMSDCLTLRLRHRASGPGVTLVADDMTGSPAFVLPIPSTLTVDDITLRPRPAPSSCITFERGIRNNLIIQVQSSGTYTFYWLQDIQLLDEGGHPYNPHLPDISRASSSRSDPGRQRIQLSDEAVHADSPSFSDAHDSSSVASTHG